jgi:hypothetical protein
MYHHQQHRPNLTGVAHLVSPPVRAMPSTQASSMHQAQSIDELLRTLQLQQNNANLGQGQNQRYQDRQDHQEDRPDPDYLDQNRPRYQDEDRPRYQDQNQRRSPRNRPRYEDNPSEDDNFSDSYRRPFSSGGGRHHRRSRESVASNYGGGNDALAEAAAREEKRLDLELTLRILEQVEDGIQLPPDFNLDTASTEEKQLQYMRGNQQMDRKDYIFSMENRFLCIGRMCALISKFLNIGLDQPGGKIVEMVNNGAYRTNLRRYHRLQGGGSLTNPMQNIIEQTFSAVLEGQFPLLLLQLLTGRRAAANAEGLLQPEQAPKQAPFPPFQMPPAPPGYGNANLPPSHANANLPPSHANANPSHANANLPPSHANANNAPSPLGGVGLSDLMASLKVPTINITDNTTTPLGSTQEEEEEKQAQEVLESKTSDSS